MITGILVEAPQNYSEAERNVSAIYLEKTGTAEDLDAELQTVIMAIFAYTFSESMTADFCGDIAYEYSS
jgi:hypothetical protein